MIHDVILSCINLHSTRLPIEEFLVGDAVPTFFHPCEKNILHDITSIIYLLRDVAKFAKIYGCNNNTSNAVTDDLLQNGLYLKAFASGIDRVLDQYFVEVIDIENRYLQNPTKSLLFIFNKLQIFEPLAQFLKKLIRCIQIKRLHGCAILQYLHQNTQHGDQRIHNAMITIQNAVNVVFMKQLTHWILYAKILDSYGEFFIQSVDIQSNTSNTLEKPNNTTGKMDTNSTYGDIWRYEISFELLPNYLSGSWADKVLFIGQTVLIFKLDSNSNKINKTMNIWNNPEKYNLYGSESLWNDKETIFFSKIQALQNDKELNVSNYDLVIDEIKGYVTNRLTEIAVNQSDLVHQLKLIKDFYLLGRGEMFLEFIRLTCKIKWNDDHDNKLRDFMKAFEAAAHSVGVLDECDQFTLNVTKPKYNEVDTTNEFGYPTLELIYKINWPLHLLFSPRVIEKYNMLFRFLLMIKKLQYELHMMWSKHTREAKLHDSKNVNVMHLRNQLMFFIDNLQYYIQVDVLESQYSLLLQLISNRADFDQIQRAHTLFQANVFSSCFLKIDDNVEKCDVLPLDSTLKSYNPIHTILNDVMHLCEQACYLFNNNKTTDIFDEIVELDKRFCTLMEQLIDLLMDLKTATSTGPLSQLLLRLDFNHWFSLQSKHEK